MYVVLAALVLVTVLAALVLLFYRSVFTEATDVTSLLATLFSVIGTVVSAYFGVKSTNDTTDKAIGQVEKEAKRTEAAHQAAREPSRG
jgi:Tfp pilus assembly protein PilN